MILDDILYASSGEIKITISATNPVVHSGELPARFAAVIVAQNLWE